MKKIIILLFAFIMIGLFQSNALESNTVRLSLGYGSQSMCDSARGKNNAEYPEYTRSVCLQSDTLYYYYICESGNSFCSHVGSLNLGVSQNNQKVISVSSTGNPFASEISVSVFPKLDLIVKKMEKMTLSRLKQLQSKLNTLANTHKSKANLLNIIKYLQYETARLIAQKEGLTQTEEDNLLCAITGDCSNQVGQSGLTDLQKQDTQANGYGLGSAKTLVGTYKGETVEIMDISAGLVTQIPNANGMSDSDMRDVINKFPNLQSKYMNSANRDHIYSLRQKSSKIGDLKHSKTHTLQIGNVSSTRWTGIPHGNITPRSTLVLSKIPGEVENSEFVGRCGLGLEGDGPLHTIGNSTPMFLLTTEGREEQFQTQLKRYTSSQNIRVTFQANSVLDLPGKQYNSSNPEDVKWLKEEYLPKYFDALYCTIPSDTEFYINIKPGDYPAKCSASEPCIITLEILPFYTGFDYNAPAINRELKRDYFDKFAGRATLSDGIIPIQYNNGVRIVKGGYSVYNDGSCAVRDPYTNSCECSSGFSPYDNYPQWTGERKETTYKCMNSNTGPIAGECGTADGIKTNTDVTYGFCKNGYTSINKIQFTKPSFNYKNGSKASWRCQGIGPEAQQSTICSATYTGGK